MLAERYPDAHAGIVMCVAGGSNERWCYQCPKCAEYAYFTLACGIVDPRFDYDRLFAKSRHIRAITGYIESGAELTELGNARWQPGFGSPTNFLVDCHAIAKVSPALIVGELGPAALGNLLTLQAAYGNRTFPTYESLPARAVDLLGHETARRIAGIAAHHLDVVDPLPGPFRSGNEEVEYDFGVRMPTKTGLLDHIRGDHP